MSDLQIIQEYKIEIRELTARIRSLEDTPERDTLIELKRQIKGKLQDLEK